MISGVLGFIVGSTLGLTGAGGGILAVPALVLGVGLSMTAAAPIALIAVGLAAFTGAIDGLRRHMVRYKAALIMSVTGGLVSPLGLSLAKQLPEFWLKLLFVGVMLTVALRMFKQHLGRTKQPTQLLAPAKPCMVSEQTGKFIWNARCFTYILSIGAFSGLLTGLLGVGGGFIIVPLLQRFTNLKIHSIVATSLMVIALISTITVFHALANASTLDPSTWPFVGFVIAGMISARLIAPRLAAATIQIGFAILCTVSAIVVLGNALSSM